MFAARAAARHGSSGPLRPRGALNPAVRLRCQVCKGGSATKREVKEEKAQSSPTRGNRNRLQQRKRCLDVKRWQGRERRDSERGAALGQGLREKSPPLEILDKPLSNPVLKLALP